ncbi:sensor histidine kinase [Moheibacter lacus]|uniref:histidine kinase n=1 Tax=Moheibacter lacus TaxID=2745851 RepID=A0A838ZU10_9FLAO|nr:HAMP domain-containing sensor histidine kinase [Moheibacter lacus]MBA5630451.1 HAMP domain-containing histidine kinase [Moheibacter lacus]
MKINRLNTIILLGLIGTIGILIAQLVWTYKAFTLEEKKFSQKVHIALLEVAREIYANNDHEISTKDLIQKVSDDYYVVNVNDDIDPAVLEHFLKTEFTKFNIITDFEYAIYNCESDDMMYGKYISVNDEANQKKEIQFEKYKDLVYYFAVRFPEEQSYLLSSLKFWIILSLVLMLILVIYVYSIYTLIQQKKYSELQRDFINNMTHEFKTPLSSILLASNSLSNQKTIQENEKLHTYAEIITQQGKKLNHHIEKILNVARNDEFAMALNPVPINLVDILGSVRNSIQTKHPEVQIQIESDPNLSILADEFHFTNVVQNLVDNSIKYSDETPEIKIQTQKVAKGIQLEFSDNGIGVSPKNLKFIFDKFYRVADKKSNEVTGFGLGLYYVKRIVQQHGWKISARNNVEKGLTISIFIPNK